MCRAIVDQQDHRLGTPITQGIAIPMVQAVMKEHHI
jgi:hypothetical protein